jgi:hypothetical protein
MACLAINGAMKLTPTAAMEVLLNLTPLDLLITAKVRMALYRLHILKQQSVPKTESGLLTIYFTRHVARLHHTSLSSH